jgi:chromosome segregation ATPase
MVALRSFPRFKAGVLAVMTLLPAGACTINEDPAKGGFISGVAGIVGGGYETRIREDEQALAREQEEAAAAAARKTDIEAQQAAVQQELAQVRQTFDQLSVRVGILRRRLDKEGAARAQDRMRLADAERRLRQVQDRITLVEDDNPVSQRREEVKDLRLALESIGGLVRTIADTGTEQTM